MNVNEKVYEIGKEILEELCGAEPLYFGKSWVDVQISRELWDKIQTPHLLTES